MAVVRTPEGSKKFGVPIGAQIGKARDAHAAQAQADKAARAGYEALVGLEQRAMLAGVRNLSTADLQKITRVAYSWATSNAAVVRLRVALANQLKARGFNVNDFGGLGGYSAGSKLAYQAAKAAAAKKAKK